MSGTITHAYTSPGVYTPALSAEASNGGHSSTTTSVTIEGSAPPPAPGVRVTFGSGWNLIGVPDGSILPSNGGRLYTWQSGDTSYETATTTQAGKGYWDLLTGDASASLAATGPSAQGLRIPLPAGQWIMIGNPYSSTATVSGADAVFVYDPSNGYQTVSMLRPGLGAWVFSSTGGTAVITSGP